MSRPRPTQAPRLEISDHRAALRAAALTALALAAALTAIIIRPLPSLAQVGGGGAIHVSPEAGSTYPWEAGLKVSTYSTANLYNGNLLTDIPVTGWPSFGPDMNFHLFHNSASAGGATPPGEGSGPGFTLGPGWSCSYTGRLFFSPSIASPTKITVMEDDGLLNEFTWNAATSQWDPPTGVYDKLEAFSQSVHAIPKKVPEDPDTGDPLPVPSWVLTRKSQWRRMFDSQGRLLYECDTYREAELNQTTGYLEGGLGIRILYDANWRIKRIRDMTPCRHLLFEYDTNGRVTKITEYYVVAEAGQGIEYYRNHRFAYDTSNRITQMGTYVYGDDELVCTVQFSYTGGTLPDRLDTITDPEQKAYDYDYDSYGRLSQVTDPGLAQGDASLTPNPQTFAYTTLTQPNRSKTTYKDRRNNNWVYIFKQWGGLISVTNPLSQIRQFTYDTSRNRLTFVNELNKTWTSTYDSTGNRLTMTDPSNHTWQWTYDAHNNLTSVTPPLNASGGLDTSKQVTIEYQDYYDVPNQLNADFTHPTKITEPADGQGNGAAETLLTYYHGTDIVASQKMGELEKILDANGVRNWFDYKVHDGVLTHWVEGPVSTGSGTYSNTEQQSTVDSGGRTTDSSSGGADGTAGHDPQNNPTGGTCKACKNNGCATAGAGHEDPPEPHMPVEDCSVAMPVPACTGTGSCWTATYDKMRKMTQFYRPLHQLHSVDPSDPYDVTFEESFRQTDYEYDNLHRLRSRSISSTEAAWQTPVATIRGLAYSYDENSNRRTMTDDEFDVTEYVYDAANRLTQVKVNGSAVVTYTLYATGRVQYADYANGTRTEWVYDDAQRLDRIIHRGGAGVPPVTVLLELDYTMTADGLVSQIDQKDATHSYSVFFDYDKRGRLIREYGTVWSGDMGGIGFQPVAYDLAYTYDQVGNRLTKVDTAAEPDVATEYHYDVNAVADGHAEDYYGSKNNRLMWSETTAGETVIERTWYAYNVSGDVKRMATRYPADAADPTAYHVKVLEYNTAGQMWLVRGYTCKADQDKHPTDVVKLFAREFRYDDDRQRYLVRARDVTDLSPVLGGDTWCQYDGDSIYKELAIDGVTGVPTETARYDHAGDGRLLAMTGGAGVPPGETRYSHGDMLGTTRVLTGSGGTAVGAQGYTAFGELVPLNSLLETRYGYCGAWGYQNDGLADANSDIGMIHVGARYYDPRIGRFLQRDPIGITGGPNVYAYGFNTPIAGVDRNGQSLGTLIGVGVVVVAVAIVIAGCVTSCTSATTMSSFSNPGPLLRNDDTVPDFETAGGRVHPKDIRCIRDNMATIAENMPGSSITQSPPADTPNAIVSLWTWVLSLFD